MVYIIGGIPIYREKYFTLLKEKYQTKEAVLTEIINLEAILNLPKGTEDFVSDLHGEFWAFHHLLRTGSGAIKVKLNELFQGKLSQQERNQLVTFIYYPKEKIQQLQTEYTNKEDLISCYQRWLNHLLIFTNYCGRKYTRSKIRKALPAKYAYILEELLMEVNGNSYGEKVGYYEAIVEKVIALGQMEELLIALADTICRLVVDHLHVVGDIYDRGPQPVEIMEQLMAFPSVDIQWGNHDINWIGACCGSKLGMVNVIRICARYDNLSILEDDYGINLRPFIQYCKKNYQVKKAFQPLKNPDHSTLKKSEENLLNLLQQGASVLQFKLQDQLIERRPEFHLQHRQLLRKIDFQKQTLQLEKKEYPLKDFTFSAFNEKNPGALTEEEVEVLQQLQQSFQTSPNLKKHMDFLLDKGKMYLVYNGNLLFHGCIPLNEDGSLKNLTFQGKQYQGKSLLDFYEKNLRYSYAHPEITEDFATDLLWYLWCGESSSLFGKLAMTTFERYHIADETTHYEKKNPYFTLRDNEAVVTDLLKHFGLKEDGHIINGHTPVKEKIGENPIKANGRLIVIDGGLAKGYQRKTGIAGYTLVYNSYGMQLVVHHPFTSIKEIVTTNQDTLTIRRVVDQEVTRKRIKETTIGEKLTSSKIELEKLFKEWNQL